MFGLGNQQELLSTRQVEDCFNMAIGEAAEGNQVWIITPYATMKKLGSIKRGIVEAAKREADITMVVRDEPGQVNPLVEDMFEAVNCGVKLCALHRLHAKVYWFENFGCIVTSANLVDGSFESSTEIGIFVSGGSLFDKIYEWIESEIRPQMRKLSSNSKDRRTGNSGRKGKAPRTSPPFEAQCLRNPSGGYCIRCGTSIEFNQKKPYCLTHFKSWSQYSNFDYTEKKCHRCGKPNESSMARPVYYACYKKE